MPPPPPPSHQGLEVWKTVVTGTVMAAIGMISAAVSWFTRGWVEKRRENAQITRCLLCGVHVPQWFIDPWYEGNNSVLACCVCTRKTKWYPRPGESKRAFWRREKKQK